MGTIETNFLYFGYNNLYFVKNHTESTRKYNEEDIIYMLDFLIDNIFVEFGELIFQQRVDIPMGTNCAPLLAGWFFYSYEAEFVQNLLKDQKHLAKFFNFTFRYIDYILSLQYPYFSQYLHVIYPRDLEINDTTDTRRLFHTLIFSSILTQMNDFTRKSMINGTISSAYK